MKAALSAAGWFLSQLTAIFRSLARVWTRLRRPGTRRLLATCATVAGVAALAGCTAPSVGGSSVVSLAEARTAVVHHWDLNRQALRATSAPEAKRLIEQVESGDALKMDEAIIARDAATRGANPGIQPAIPGATGVRVYVPRQSAYPASFLSIRTEAQTDPSGAPTGKNVQVLELFRRASAADQWHNTGYAEVGTGLAGKLDFALDRDGYAAFATGSPSGADLTPLYTTYMGAMAAGKPAEAGKRIQAGPLTDQFISQLKQDLAAAAAVRSTVTFATSPGQQGIMLKTSDGGRFVLFDNLYDIASAPAGGGCVTAGPGSAVPGSFSSVTEHFLQNVGAVVAPGTDGAVTVVAESDSPVSTDTKPCTGGGSVV